MNDRKTVEQTALLIETLSCVVEEMKNTGTQSAEKLAAAEIVIRELRSAIPSTTPQPDSEGLASHMDIRSVKEHSQRFVVALAGMARRMVELKPLRAESIAAGERVCAILNGIMANDYNFEPAFDHTDTMEGIAFLGASRPIPRPE